MKQINYKYKITGLYALFGLLWIALSDVIVFNFQSQNIFLWQLIKGFVYVLLTTAFLYFLLKYFLQEQEKLSEKNQRDLQMHREAQKVAHIGSWNFDLVENTLSWSDNLYHIFGTHAKAFRNSYQSFLDFVVPEHKLRVKDLNKKIQETGEPFQVIYEIEKPNGERRIIEEHGYAEKNLQGKIVRLYGTAQDITEREKTQEKLRLSKQNFDAIIHALPDLLFVFNRKLTINFVHSNYPTQELLMPIEDMFGKKINDILPPEMVSTTTEKIRLAFDTDQLQTWEYSLRVGGKEAWFEARFIKASDNEVFALTRNITKDKNWKIRITESNQLLAQAEKTAGMGSWSFDAIHQESWWSDNLYHIMYLDKSLGFPSQEEYLKAIHPQDRHLIEANMQRMFQGEAFEDKVFRTHPENGKVKILRPLTSYQKDNQGNITKYFGAIVDITALEESLTALSESRTMYKTVAENITDVIWIYDIQKQRLSYISPSIEAFRGISMEEALLQNPEDSLPIKYAEILKQWQYEAFQEISSNPDARPSKTFKLETYHNEGHLFWVELKAYIEKDAQNNWVVIGASRNIDAEVKAQEAQRENEYKFRVAAEHSPNWDYWKAPNGEFVYVSPGCKTITGYDPQDFIQDKSLLKRIMHPDDWLIWLNHSEADAQNHTKHEPMRLRYQTKEGKKVIVEHICKPIFDEKGQYLGQRGVNLDITQKVEAEELNKQLLSIIDLGKDLVGINALDGKLLYINSTGRKMMGIPEDADLSQYYSQDFHVEENFGQLREEHLQTALTTGSWTGRSQLKSLSGRIINCIQTVIAITDENQNIQKICTTATDITEILNTTQELEKSLRLVKNYKYALDESTMISISDLRGQIIEINEKFLSFNGYTKEEVLGKNHNLFKSGLHTQEFYKELWNTLLQGKIWQGEVCNRKKNGELYWTFNSIVPFINEDNRPYQFIAIRHNITDRKNFERELIESNERFKLATKATSDVIWDWDLVSDAFKWGANVEAVFGFKATPHDDSHSWKNRVHPEDLDRILGELNQSLENGLEFWQSEYRFYCDNGFLSYIRDQGTIIRDAEGKAVRMIGAMQDITQEREYLEAIQNQNARLKQIAWMQSHEVRAPLSRLLGVIENMESFEQSGMSRNEIKEIVNQSAIELENIIKNITDKTDLMNKE